MKTGVFYQLSRFISKTVQAVFGNRPTIRYDTIYDTIIIILLLLWSFVKRKIRINTPNALNSVYLTCSKKLTGSQLSLPQGVNKKLKGETKNKMMSVIGPV